jgi:hypothetical protein
VWQDNGVVVAVKQREPFLRYFKGADELAPRALFVCLSFASGFLRSGAERHASRVRTPTKTAPAMNAKTTAAIRRRSKSSPAPMFGMPSRIRRCGLDVIYAAACMKRTMMRKTSPTCSPEDS